jgi:acetyltransferase-like isoleucine patch superfamily enzyme
MRIFEVGEKCCAAGVGCNLGLVLPGRNVRHGDESLIASSPVRLDPAFFSSS